jgi:hypothetical protein
MERLLTVVGEDGRTRYARDCGGNDWVGDTVTARWHPDRQDVARVDPVWPLSFYLFAYGVAYVLLVLGGWLGEAAQRRKIRRLSGPAT